MIERSDKKVYEKEVVLKFDSDTGKPLPLSRN
jgi:hypothetical protein